MEKGKDSYFFSISRSEMEYSMSKHFGGSRTVVLSDVKYGFRYLAVSDMIVIDGLKRCTELLLFQSKDEIYKYLLRDDITLFDNRLYKIYFVIPNDVYLNYTEWLRKVVPQKYGIVTVEKYKSHNHGLSKTVREAIVNPNYIKLELSEIWDIMRCVKDVRWKQQNELLNMRKVIKKHEKYQNKRYKKITKDDNYGGKYFK